MASQAKHIVVIGAGVTGLTTAVALLKAGYQVTILAKYFPGDLSIEYTSPWAGAHWQSHAASDDHEQGAWDIETYKHWMGILKQGEDPEMGLRLYTQRYSTPDTAQPWYAREVKGFESSGTRIVDGHTLYNHSFLTIGINSPKYLAYLLNTATSLGAMTRREMLPGSSSLADNLRLAADLVKANVRQTPIAAFVNATGLQARFLVPDENVFPIRGQTVTVKGEAKDLHVIYNPTPTTQGVSPDVTYILTRPMSGTTIIGGTTQRHVWTAEAVSQTTQEILERAREFAPELLNTEGKFEFVSAQAGLRPGRTSGARVEVEEVRLPGGLGEKVVAVCHAYGHAGGGYQNSIGSASKVVRLLDEYFAKSEAVKAKL